MRARTARLRGAMLIAAPLLLVAACGGVDSMSDAGGAAGEEVSTEDRPALTQQDAAVDGAAPAPAQNIGQQSPVLTPVEREVIATAEVTIRVDDVAETLPDVTRAATSVGGYVAGEDTSSDPDDPSKTRSTIVLRVPTDTLPRVLDDVTDLGELMRSRQDVRDVTEQVVDVNSRVKSARASVARIRVLLDQATTLGEVVRIESQLAKREADLESLLAQQRSLADQTAMATLTVTALGPEAATPVPAEEDETGFVAGLSRGWDAFVDVIVVGLTAVGLLLPFALAGALILVPLWFIWRRRQDRARSDETPEPSTA
jgi:hypothetical protein